mgnify:CR=1 FL=1
MMIEEHTKCIFCEKDAIRRLDNNTYFYTCPRCGMYSYINSEHHNIMVLINRFYKDISDTEKNKFETYCAYLFCKFNYNKFYRISPSSIKNIIDNYRFISIQEQIDVFIYTICSYMQYPKSTDKYSCVYDEFYNRFGCVDNNAFMFLCNVLKDQSFVRSSIVDKPIRKGEIFEFSLTPTVKAWEHFENLKSGRNVSNKAFLALQFNGEMNRELKQELKDAVFKTGFILNTVDEEPKAGLIDDKIKLDIRNSRFIIADLTDGNKGAYWEAGFADGLGKSVIYMCREDVMKDIRSINHPHFDVSHHQCILWSKENFDEALKKLKNTIRYTFPDAKQDD